MTDITPAEPAGRGEQTRALHPEGTHGGPAMPELRSAAAPAGPAGRPMSQPVWRSAAFAFDAAEDFADLLAGRVAGWSYGRVDAPNADAFAADLAALEAVGAPGEIRGQAFASGMAAISTVLLALCDSGSHVVAANALYGNTTSLLSGLLARFGVTTTFVDPGDLAAVTAAIRADTALVYCETIANPTLAVADVPALAGIAHAAGVPLVVDSTFATPVVYRPLAGGADLVVHAATKFLGGHGDVTGGVVAGDAALVARVRAARIDLGGALAPDDAWLLQRGLATLPLRMERHCATALAVATALAADGRFTRVLYPGLPTHPDHALATRLFAPGRYGGIVTLTPPGGRAAGLAYCDRLRLVANASSLGSVHAKVSHVATTTHRQLTDEGLAAAGIDPADVRLSVGLEDADDLVADLLAALG